VHIAKQELEGIGKPVLDGKQVNAINSRLHSSSEVPDPVPLSANDGLGFFGTKLGGSGFILEADEYARLAANPYNRRCLLPLLAGQEVNQSPTQSHERYAICFGSEPLEFAQQFPDLLDVVRTRVKPERDRALDHGPGKHGKKYWWQFTLRADPLYQAISILSRCLVTVIHTGHLAFSFQPIQQVFSHALVVFAVERFGPLACLQSRVHLVWAQLTSSSLGSTLRYSVSDTFQTFPLPENWESHPALEATGKAYYELRATLMIQNNEGLTQTYNRFNDPDERNPDILKLRELHAAMDHAVINSYGWSDMKTDCGFFLDYEIDDEEWGNKKKPWRYRWPDEVRDEVLPPRTQRRALKRRSPFRHRCVQEGGQESGSEGRSEGI
jgi:hypothetical protein